MESTKSDGNRVTTVMTCPFCQEKAEGEYAMMLHMETLHPEDGCSHPNLTNTTKDPNTTKDQSPQRIHEEDDIEYTECPVDGCGDLLTNEMIDFHAELHAAEEAGSSFEAREARPGQLREARVDSSSSSSGPSRSQREAERHRRAKPEGSSSKHATLSWKTFFRLPELSRPLHGTSKSGGRSEDKSSTSSEASKRLRRLGKSQLGQHANEARMPDSLVSLLKEGKGYNSSEGVVPVVAQLLEQSSTTQYAYLCHPCVQHISKLKKEGAFCGYRNIQMLCSYIIGVKFQGVNNINRRIPSIFHIQDYIEAAWDAGHNKQGRIETGGIKGTRKYIGTPEALAMFKLLDIPCDAQGFKNSEPGRSEALLYEYVETYFRSGTFDPMAKVRQTNLPPIYFQHAGHSMTIIGTERLRSGENQLLVFDPSFRDSSEVLALVGQDLEVRYPDKALRQYRRGSYLRKFREFEVLRLSPTAEGFPPIS